MSHQKHALRRLVEINNPKIMFLQETLGEGIFVIKFIEALLKGWTLIGIDANRRFRGLVVGWKCRIFVL